MWPFTQRNKKTPSSSPREDPFLSCRVVFQDIAHELYYPKDLTRLQATQKKAEHFLNSLAKNIKNHPKDYAKADMILLILGQIDLSFSPPARNNPVLWGHTHFALQDYHFALMKLVILALTKSTETTLDPAIANRIQTLHHQTSFSCLKTVAPYLHGLCERALGTLMMRGYIMLASLTQTAREQKN